MTVTYNDLRTLIRPGGTYSADDLINALAGVLSDAQMTQLATALATTEAAVIRPGDLITADLVNQMLSNIADLQMRMADVETGSGSQLVLTSPSDGDMFRDSDNLVIEGRNLGFSSGRSIVTVAGKLVTSYLSGSSDTKITCKFPGIAGVNPSGTQVPLVVSNGVSSAQRNITIRSARDLAGAIDVTWLNVTPNPLQAGQPATFEFSLNSRANFDASYSISPTISRVANAVQWQSATTVLDKNGQALPSGKIAVPAGGNASIKVRINPVPNVAAGTSFALSVSATSGAVFGTSGRLQLSVGSLIQLPDPDIVVTIDHAEFIPAVGGGSLAHGPDSDTLKVSTGGKAQLSLSVQVKRAGNYVGRIAPISSPESPTANWDLVCSPIDAQDPSNRANSLFSVTQQQLDQAGGIFSLGPRFVITPKAGASSAGEAEISMERQGSGLRRSIIISLQTP